MSSEFPSLPDATSCRDEDATVVEFDEQAGKLVIKLVYYGPALSGKTTNLLSLHDQLCDEGRSDLMVLDTVDDRTIFFDLMPLFYQARSGFRIKLKVYTVPGQVCHDATRKAVLQRADGIVFVADSQRVQMTNNAESFANLEKNMAMVGLDIDKVPLVIQFNKRDLDDVVSEAELQATWEPTGLPLMMASALNGAGVVETYRTLVERSFDVLDRRLGLVERFGIERNDFVDRVTRVQ